MFKTLVYLLSGHASYY